MHLKADKHHQEGLESHRMCVSPVGALTYKACVQQCHQGALGICLCKCALTSIKALFLFCITTIAGQTPQLI